jgi:hypothetical protein
MGAQRGPGDLSAGIARTFIIVAGLAHFPRINPEQPDSLAPNADCVTIGQAEFMPRVSFAFSDAHAARRACKAE